MELLQYKTHINSITGDMSFMARIPGMVWSPFAFSGLNLKTICLSDSTTLNQKKYILTVLKLCIKYCEVVYTTITSPDVDVEEFSKLIIGSISKIKKNIPRCGRAFDKIEESVKLLQSNFGVYYKDFIQSQNPSSIIESFVIDVSNNGDADIQLAKQFRTIIAYYQKATAGKIKDPKLKKVFSMLNANLEGLGE